MNEYKDHMYDTMSYLSLPLYQGYTRILIYPTQVKDEVSSYQVWSPSRNIPPDIKSSEIKKISLPFYSNHLYIAMPSDQSSPLWCYYQSQPDCSMFKSSVKLYSFEVIIMRSIL